MRNLILNLALLLTGFTVFSQASAIVWQKSLGSFGYDGLGCPVQTPDGGFILTGNSGANDGDVTGWHGNYDIWVVKLSSTGAIEWQKSYGSPDNEAAWEITTTADGGYVLCGYSILTGGDVTVNHGSRDFWVIKITATGDIQWQKSYGGPDDEIAESIRQANDGGYIVAGFTETENGGDVVGAHYHDGWVVKLDASGNMQWQKPLGGTFEEDLRSVRQTTDGGYICSGSVHSNDGDVSGNNGDYDGWVVKLNASGNIEWQKPVGGEGIDGVSDTEQTADGGYITVGGAYSNTGDFISNHGQMDVFLTKLDVSGNIQWQKLYGGSGVDYGYSVRQMPDGGYVMAGSTRSADGDVTNFLGLEDYWIIRVNAAGELIWQRTLGGTFFETAQGVIPLSDGGFLVSGQSGSNDGDVTGNHYPSYDGWVVKLGAEPLSVRQFGQSAINVFPNPAETELNLFHPDFPLEKVTITNLLGQIVFSKSGSMIADVLQIGSLESGIYILEAFGSNRSETVKFIKK